MEQAEPKRIVEPSRSRKGLTGRIRPPADPLQAAAKYDVHTLPRTMRSRWFDMPPQVRLALAALMLAPLILSCAIVAGMMAR